MKTNGDSTFFIKYEWLLLYIVLVAVIKINSQELYAYIVTVTSFIKKKKKTCYNKVVRPFYALSFIFIEFHK